MWGDYSIDMSSRSKNVILLGFLHTERGGVHPSATMRLGPQLAIFAPHSIELNRVASQSELLAFV